MLWIVRGAGKAAAIAGLIGAAWTLGAASAAPWGDDLTLAAVLLSLAFGLLAEARRRRDATIAARRLAAAQRRAAQAAHGDAMGDLTGALAHELSQPLSALANYLSVARDGAARGDLTGLTDVLDRAAAQAVRAGVLVAGARAGVRQPEVLARPQSLDALVREAVDVAVAAHAGVPPTVRYDLDPACDEVIADRFQVQQVVLNLVRNALEAMGGTARRELTIAGRPGEPGFVAISVSDTGPGLPPGDAERIFEPFVTSKPDGMGLGLSISQRIVRAHGGRIWAESAIPGGAAFHFSLPRA